MPMPMPGNTSSQGQRATCSACGSSLSSQSLSNFSAYPAGVKFEPTDEQLMLHLAARLGIDGQDPHPDLDKFIPTLDDEDGICGMHPDLLPGSRRDGTNRHYFHRPARAYSSGTRKRRKIQIEENGVVQETRWHKTGKTRPVLVRGRQVGCKKILVMYASKKGAGGGREKDEKTNWVMHQYHLGREHQEKEGEWVVSKVFWQIQPRQCTARKPAAEKNEQSEQEGEADPEPEGHAEAEADPEVEAGELLAAIAREGRVTGKRKAETSALTFALDTPIGGGVSGQQAAVTSATASMARKRLQLSRDRGAAESAQEEALQAGTLVAAPPLPGNLRLQPGQTSEDAPHLSEVGSSQEVADFEDGEGAVSGAKAAAAAAAAGTLSGLRWRIAPCGAHSAPQKADRGAAPAASHGSLMCSEADVNCLEDSEGDDEGGRREDGSKQDAGGRSRGPCRTSAEGPAGITGSQEPLPDSQMGSLGGLTCAPSDSCAFADGLICTPTDEPLSTALLGSARKGAGGTVKETRDFMAKFGESAGQDQPLEAGVGQQQQQQGEGHLEEGPAEDAESSQASLELHLSQPLPQIGSQEVNKLFEGLPALSQMDGLVSPSQSQSQPQPLSRPPAQTLPQPKEETRACAAPAALGEPRSGASGSHENLSDMKPLRDEHDASESLVQLLAGAATLDGGAEGKQLPPLPKTEPEAEHGPLGKASSVQENLSTPPKKRRQPGRDVKKLASRPITSYFSM